MAFDLLSTLREGLTGEPSPGRPAGIEIRQDLAPAGGMPVQPPSYEDPLEIHPRYIDGELHDVVELDSVGSAANRLEEVLIDLHQTGRYPLPVSSTTVSPTDEQPITITTLEMPHRVFDAWLRLSEAGDGSDGAFEDSEHGRELSLAHAGALDALLETSAHQAAAVVATLAAARFDAHSVRDEESDATVVVAQAVARRSTAQP